MDADSTGYSKPPKSTRFKKGRSGNPKGRPKGARSLKTDLAKLMEKRVRIREDGEQRQVSGQELMLLKLFQKALTGDTKAVTQIFGMLMKFEAADPPQKESEVITDNDRAIVLDFLNRNSPSKTNERES